MASPVSMYCDANELDTILERLNSWGMKHRNIK